MWDNSYKPCHGVGTAALVNHKFLSMKGGDGKYHVVLSPCDGGHASPLEWSAKAVFDTKPSGQDVKDAMLNDGVSNAHGSRVSRCLTVTFLEASGLREGEPAHRW